MDITFGIITGGTNDSMLSMVIDSIYRQNIPKYEIIIVGNTTIRGQNIINIPFDESIKPNWITRKKNIINETAKYEIIVQLHDYIRLDDNWYQGMLKFGDSFDICNSKIMNLNGRRFRDYKLFVHSLPSYFMKRALFPYTYQPNINVNKLMYISGAYYIIKKKTALEYPLNENLVWGNGEDVELSQRLSDNAIFLKCNPYSIVHFLKEKPQCEWENEMTNEDLAYLDSFSEEGLVNMVIVQRAYLKNWIFKTCNVII
jgi:hypothetical protein